MSDTIDIEDFANAVKSSLLKYLLSVVLAIPEVAKITAIPIVGPLFKKLIEWILSLALGQAGLAAFIINTKVFTYAQAQDYIDALKKLERAPEGVSDEEWAKLEDEATRAFSNLIRFSA